MRRTAHPPGREEPSFDEAADLDIETDDYTEQRVVAPPPPRPGIFRRIVRGLRNLLLVLLIIVGLSYLPDSWSQQQHPHIQEALRICDDIRELLYRVAQDLWQWLETGVPRWYTRLHALLPATLSDHLPLPGTHSEI